MGCGLVAMRLKWMSYIHLALALMHEIVKMPRQWA